MITFIDEEKDNGTGVDWIEINSQHSDICSISVGQVTFDGAGQANTEYASYALIGLDILKLHSFIQSSELGDTLILEWRSDDEVTSQTLAVVDFRSYFKVSVVEEKVENEEKVSEYFSYDVDRVTFLKAVEEMRELYGSVNGEQS